jgi:hypothetical protein
MKNYFTDCCYGGVSNFKYKYIEWIRSGFYIDRIDDTYRAAAELIDKIKKAYQIKNG